MQSTVPHIQGLIAVARNAQVLFSIFKTKAISARCNLKRGQSIVCRPKIEIDGFLQQKDAEST